MTPQDPGNPFQPAPEYHPPAQPPRRERSGLAIALLAVLVVAALGLGVWIYTALLGGDSDGDGTAAATSTTPLTVTSTAAPTTSEAPVTVTVTETPTPEETTPEETTPEETTPEETTPEATPTPTQTEPGYRAPASAEQCAANVNWRIFRANDQTSCGFAEAVAVQMAPYTGLPGSALIYATSPVTGQEYEMRCIGQGGNSFVCEGGDNAVVILEDRSVRD